jgi:predicted DNA-binding transcriptional regulator AlpA
MHERIHGMMKLLRFSELQAHGIPWTRAHIDRQERSGKFPRRVHLGDATIAWVAEEIDAYVATRIAERDAVATEEEPAEQ